MAVKIIVLVIFVIVTAGIGLYLSLIHISKRRTFNISSRPQHNGNLFRLSLFPNGRTDPFYQIPVPA